MCGNPIHLLGIAVTKALSGTFAVLPHDYPLMQGQLSTCPAVPVATGLGDSTVSTERPDAHFDYTLEALRGLAALMVVFTHALSDGPTVEQQGTISGIWQYGPPGHLAVLVFFMLSGYVIGLTNPRPIATGQGRKLYTKKRLVRLYPLYLISLAVTLAVGVLLKVPYTLGTVTGWLLFLQGAAVPVPGHNTPIWSLGYEVLYYGLFLVVSAYQWRPERVALAFLLLGFAITKLPGVPLILTTYSYGGVFWFLGMYLAKAPRSNQPPQYGTMLAFLLLMFSFSRLNLGGSVIEALHLNVTPAQAPILFDRIILFSDFSCLLLCVPLLLCFTNRTLPGQHWAERAAFVTPAFYVLAYAYSGKITQPALFNTSILAMTFYAVALGAYFGRYRLGTWGVKVLRALTPLGPVSYGLYIIHYPLLFLFREFTFFSGTTTTFIVRLALYLALSLSLAWLLELKLQPWIKRQVL